MDVSPKRLFQLLFPKIPTILKTYVLSKLSLSPNSDKQDTRTEVVVCIIRSVMGGAARPIKVIQDGSTKDLVVKGKMWVAKCAIPAGETDSRDVVLQAIKELGNGSEQFALPEICDISGEWNGYRECEKNTPRLDLPEEEQYQHMMKEVTSKVTVLYFHGGAYILMDPASHRGTTSGLAKKTGGRCFSVRYRLAPQSAFPCQLIDAFNAYLYLLAPPEGAFHSPVLPSTIVLAGDSAGGNLASALMLLLITLKHTGVETVTYHGKTVRLELPAGMALNSPWTDISRSLPTVRSNARFDYLDPPTATGLPARELPPDEIWPATPPRAEMFCTASLLTHPLVSPVLATPKMWEGVSPTFICCGNEGLEDESTVVARNVYKAGGDVEFAAYEGMPHCFAMVFPASVAGKDCFDKWAQFMVRAVEGQVERKPTGQWMRAFSNPASFRDVDLSSMGVPDDEVQSRIIKTKEMALDREQDAIMKWERDLKAKL